MKKVVKVLRKYRELIMGVIDTIAIILAYISAYYIRMDFGTLFSSETMEPVFHNLIWVALLNLVFLHLFKVSKSLWTYLSIDEVIRVSLSIACTNIVWMIIVIVLPIRSYPRSLPIIAMLIQAVLSLGVRILYRLYRRTQMQSQRHHRALIIGAGAAGSIIQRDLTVTDKYDCKVVGFIDDAPEKKDKIIAGTPVLGTTDELDVVAEKYNIDIAYIAIKNISKERLKEILEKCREAHLKTQIISFEAVEGENAVEHIRDVSIDDLLGRGEIKLDDEGIKGFIGNKVVMVTGAGGSIGSELVRQLIRFNPKQLVLVDIYENTMYELQQEIKINVTHHKMNDVPVTCLIGSVRDRKRIDAIMKQYQPNVVFHAAAHKHVPLVEDSPMEAIKNNVFGTYNMVQCSIENKVEKFVLISTDKAVNPTNVMGATKRMCELILQGYRDNGVTKLCAVRFGNVLGSHGSVIPLFKKQIEEGGPVTVTDPNIIRYFMTIPEAARLVIQAGVYANSGELFVLDMGQPVKILDLAKNLIRLSGFEPDVDIKIEFTGLRPGEKMYEELLYKNDMNIKTDNDLIFISEPIAITQEEVDQKLKDLREVVETDGDYRTAIMDAITLK